VTTSRIAPKVQRDVADALVVHRLDMATSGLLLFARGPTLQRAYSMAFEARSDAQSYVALVMGDPGHEQGQIVPLAPIGRTGRGSR
jgi:tRNA pseudouridine32 synthase/23S rRNA pseudouridine746 synthase